MFISFDPNDSRKAKNPFVKILAFIAGIVALAMAMIFSFVIFAVVAAIGAVVWLYFLWKTRALREEIRGRMEGAPAREEAARHAERKNLGGRVIEGEAIEVPDDFP